MIYFFTFRYSNTWVAIPALLVIIVFVLSITLIIKIWMFNVPTRKRIIPSYSLHVMDDIPPDHSHRSLKYERLNTNYDSTSLSSGLTRSTAVPGYKSSDPRGSSRSTSTYRTS